MLAAPFYRRAYVHCLSGRNSIHQLSAHIPQTYTRAIVSMATPPRSPPAKRQKLSPPPSPSRAAASTSAAAADAGPSMVPADHAPTRQPDAENTTPSQLNYWNGLFLAPMVRIGSLPTRLLSLEYGADLVWGPEIVDRAIIGTTRQVDERTGLVEYMKDGRQIFSTHPIEKPYLIYQIGSATPELAAEAAKLIADDVSAVDLNCGCPKNFSTSGGMGAELLSTPDKLCAILDALRQALPPRVAVTAKIRLLPESGPTLDLVRRIIRTGVSALTVHCRTKDMRPRQPALLHRLREIVDCVREESQGRIPVVCNGDCWDWGHVEKIKTLTGVTSVMIARGAEANPSCFSSQGTVSVPGDIAPRWIRYALAFNNPIGNTKYCVTQLNFKAESAAETVAHVKGGKKARQAVRDELARAKTHEDMAVALGMDPSIEKARQVEEVLSVLTARLAERPERPREPSEAGSEIEGHLRVLEERAAPEVTAAQPLDSAHHMPEWQAEERGRTLVDAV